MSKISQEQWIERFRFAHGDKYNYDFIDIINSHVPVKIICAKHGEFLQRPDCHYLRKHGCPKCASEQNAERAKKGASKFIEEANVVHNNFYDYSLVEYKQNKVRVQIICPIHGSFSQIPLDHLRGYGCKKCSNKKRTVWPEEDDIFLRENYLLFGSKYCAEKLGKTVSAVVSRAQMLRCVKNVKEEYINENIPRGIIAGIRKRMDEHGENLDFNSDYLFNLLEEQNFRCALSGLEICFSTNPAKENTASVDRIDSRKHYSKDNIQIVHKKFNRFKNNLDEKELLDMCKLVVKNLGARFSAIDWVWDIMNDTEVPIKVIPEKPVLEKDRYKKWEDTELF